MRARIQKELMFVLAVQIDESRGRFPQRRRRRERPIEEGAASTGLRRNLTLDDELCAAGVFEDRFDRGLLLPRPDEIG
jgi:hypothetical protein